MLKITPESYVWIYSKVEGIRIFPAISVASSNSQDVFDLYSRSVLRFFELHFECFIGDRKLDSAKPETLENLQVDYILEQSVFFDRSQ